MYKEFVNGNFQNLCMENTMNQHNTAFT